MQDVGARAAAPTSVAANPMAANARRANGDRGGMISKLLVSRMKRIER